MASIKIQQEEEKNSLNQISFDCHDQLKPLKNHSENLDKKQTILKSIRATFVSWCKKSDVNGISKIFEYDNGFVRLFFFFILLLSLAFTAFVMASSIFNYFEHEVVSKILVVYEQPTEFPAVTFCDNQPFTTQEGLDFVDKFHNSLECSQKNCSKNLANLKAADPFFGAENRKKLGLNIDQISCSYNNMDCNLKWCWNYEFGSCFQFNVDINGTNSKLMANVAGRDYGLRIKINNFTSPNISKLGVFPGLGLIVYVHNKTVQPRWFEEGVFVKPGEITLIGVKRKFISNEPSPFTYCTDLKSYSSFLYDYIIKSNRTYRQKDCLDLCIQLETIEKCGCYYTGDENPKSDSTRPCLNISEYDCYVSLFYKFDSAKCAAKYCPLECKSIEYDLSVTSKISPTFNEYKSMNVSSSISYEEWRTQFLNVHFYYSQLEYTLIEETPAMTVSSLVANLGGIMGLIVSVSFFTIIEIIELLCLILYSCLTKQ